MKINPQQKLKDILFYNNICLIVAVFCVICFITALFLQNSYAGKPVYILEKNDSTFGPIKVTDKSKVYRAEVYFLGSDSSSYVSGEILDENGDTVYEFGKDLWHESGYDAEGYWSESDNVMTADLTFSKKGTYYIQFRTEENNIRQVRISMRLKKGSYIPHMQAGTIFLLLIIFIFSAYNPKWMKQKMIEFKEEMEDD